MDKLTIEQTVGLPSAEELFQGLPPLGSDDCLQHVQTASTLELPAEVLARAFRQLPPETVAARVTLERLFRKVGERWEYLGPIAARARRRAKAQQSRNRADEDQDLLQDAITRICGVLPTARGELAERAWIVFCRNAFEDAWRERYGRRGEKLRWIREDPDCSAEGEEDDPIDRLSNDESPWRVIWEHEQSERILAIVASVASSIQDPFAQQVARAAWGSGERPKTSGAEAADRNPPLTARFPGKSPASDQPCAASRGQPAGCCTAGRAVPRIVRRHRGVLATAREPRKVVMNPTRDSFIDSSLRDDMLDDLLIRVEQLWRDSDKSGLGVCRTPARQDFSQIWPRVGS